MHACMPPRPLDGRSRMADALACTPACLHAVDARIHLAGCDAAQVHEKSILLPLLPLTALAAASPLLATWLPLVACFSMYPLLVRDGQALPYVALCALYCACMAPVAGQCSREGLERLEASHPKGEAGRHMHACMGRPACEHAWVRSVWRRG